MITRVVFVLILLPSLIACQSAVRASYGIERADFLEPFFTSFDRFEFTRAKEQLASSRVLAPMPKGVVLGRKKSDFHVVEIDMLEIVASDFLPLAGKAKNRAGLKELRELQEYEIFRHQYKVIPSELLAIRRYLFQRFRENLYALEKELQ